MSELYRWWSKPKNDADIEEYIEKICRFSGDGLWSKLVKDVIRTDINKQLGEISHVQEDEGDGAHSHKGE